MRDTNQTERFDVFGTNAPSHCQMLRHPAHVKFIRKGQVDRLRKTFSRRIFWKECHRHTRPATIDDAYHPSCTPAPEREAHMRRLRLFRRGWWDRSNATLVFF